MTRRQLRAVTDDYQGFLPIKGVITACERAHAGPKSTCDICGLALCTKEGWEFAAKQLVVVPAGQFAVRHYRLLVCRNGVKCRERRQKQIEYPLKRKSLIPTT